MTELWSLLNFVMPQIFSRVEIFDALLELQDLQEDNFISDKSTNESIVNSIQQVLKPFMLRRMKCDVLPDNVPKRETLVYCPLTVEQRDLYSDMLKERIRRLSLRGGEDTEKLILPPNSKRTRYATYGRYVIPSAGQMPTTAAELDYKNPIEQINLANPMMTFKKIVNHPYLVDPKNFDNLLINENMVNKSGKMKVFDVLLTRLLENGHKVLVFSTLVIMLDIMEDYMRLRKISYSKLNGSMNVEERQKEIDKFNNDPSVGCFLISTRAGGLGLNLTAADTVIFYDRDWNPHADSQAQARCHRIGQTKPVMVYTLLTKDTIDEKILNCGELKKRLENIIIKNSFKSFDLKTDDLLKLLKAAENTVTVAPNGAVFTEDELAALVDRSDLVAP